MIYHHYNFKLCVFMCLGGILVLYLTFSAVSSFKQGIVAKRELKYLNNYESPRQAWVENLNTPEEKKLGIIHLHPDVFGVMPRIDVIQENVRWQTLYKHVVSS